MSYVKYKKKAKLDWATNMRRLWVGEEGKDEEEDDYEHEDE